MTEFVDGDAAEYTVADDAYMNAMNLCDLITQEGMPEHGLAAGERGFFLGGATLDRWEIRSAHPLKYPDGVDGLFEPVVFLVLFGMPNPADSAGAEETSMQGANLVELAAALNFRVKVSLSEHRNASPARPGSVYMRVAKQVKSPQRSKALISLDLPMTNSSRTVHP